MLEVKREARLVAAGWAAWMGHRRHVLRVATLLAMAQQRLPRVRHDTARPRFTRKEFLCGPVCFETRFWLWFLLIKGFSGATGALLGNADRRDNPQRRKLGAVSVSIRGFHHDSGPAFPTQL
jgi:hypothetical protein